MSRHLSLSVSVMMTMVAVGSAHAQWSTNGAKIFYNNGNVGIGTPNPNSPLQIVSDIGSVEQPTLLVKTINVAPAPLNATIRGINRGIAGNGFGVWGSQDGDGVGVFGSVENNGDGVRGHAVGQFGNGVHGIADGANGAGLWGEAVGIAGIAVLGESSGINSYAGFFEGRGYFGDNLGLGELDPSFQLELSLDSAGKPTSNTWTISSDRRLKKNIQSIDRALDDLLALKGVTYQWRNPETQGNMAGTYTGMIAQDVEKVFPEWVREGKDGYKTLTVIGFEGIVVEAVRELRAEKDAEIAELHDIISEMRAEIETLKTQRTGAVAAN